MCGFARSQSPQALFDLMQLITGPQPQQLEPVQSGVVKSARYQMTYCLGIGIVLVVLVMDR